MDDASETVPVVVRPAVASRIDALVHDAPEFAFRDRRHFIESAILSFLSFKERELASIRRGER